MSLKLSNPTFGVGKVLVEDVEVLNIVDGDLLIGSSSNFEGFSLQLPNNNGLGIRNSGNNGLAAFFGASTATNFSAPGNNAIIRSTENILFASGNQLQATLTSSGNLLVGTTIAFAKFAVQGDAYVGGGNDLSVGNVNNTNAASINSDSADTSASLVFKTAAAGLARTERARITSGGYFKASNTGVYGGVAGLGTDLVGSSDFIFQTNSTGLLGGGVCVLTDQTANTAVNFSSYHPSGATGFHFVGTVQNAGVTFRVLSNGNVQNLNNSYGALSDAKLKENIVDTSPKLDDLTQVRIVNYNLISDPTLKQIGVIAQELEEIFPGLVDSTPDIDPETKEPTGTVTKSVKYSVFVPILIKALQEETAARKSLEDRIAAIEASLGQ